MKLNSDTLAIAIRNYNKYRAPEVVAELLEIGKGILRVIFRSDFRCCILEWFEDLEYELKDAGIDVEIVDMEEIDPFTFIVTYKIKSVDSPPSTGSIKPQR